MTTTKIKRERVSLNQLLPSPIALSEEQLNDLKQKRDQGIKIKALMQEFKLSKATVYRYLAQEV